MPIFVMAVVALVLFLVMGVLFITAAMLEGKRRREVSAELDTPATSDVPEVKTLGAGAGK